MGRLDIDCSAEGVRAIQAETPNLSWLVPDVVLCSPLKRAVTTAQGLFPVCSVQITPDLIERDLGDWSGLLKEEVRKTYADAFLESGKMDPFYCPPGGESWADFQRRGEEILTMLESYPEDTTVVAVTHNGIIRLLRHLASQLPADQIFAADEAYLQPIQLHLGDQKKPTLQGE